MFRTARRISPTLSSLLCGALTAAGMTLAMGAVTGCADENAPETHVEKLSDPTQQAAAVNRLVQFFEDAMTRDNKDRNGPSVKPLLDKIVQPMADTCVNGNLDEKTMGKLVQFLSDSRDPRAEGCLIKVLKEYKVDSTEDLVRSAARAVGPMKLKSAAGPLFEAFTKLRPSKQKASLIYRDVHDALVDLVDPAWEAQCITLLGRPINDRKDVQNLKDELFWQITAAELLGLLKSEKAVKPLIKVVLSPMKADAASTAINALIKIGKPALAPTIALLKGEDNELMEYAKVEFLKGAAGPDGKAPEAAQKDAGLQYPRTAAIILGTIGRPEAQAPMIGSLEKADDITRAIVGREMTKLPASPELLQAIQKAYDKTPVTASIPPGAGAREAQLEAMGYLFDASLVPWIVKNSLDLKGEDGDLEPIRASALLTSMKLMKADQVADVEKLSNAKITGPDGKPSTLGKGYEKEWKLAKELVTACGEKVDCYLAKMTDPASQTTDGQFAGMKAGYMIGILGSPDVRQKLVEAMPKMPNAALRFIAVQVIDRFSPKGDTALAAQLQKIVDDAEASKDGNKIASVAPVKTVIYRLNARAQ